MSKTTEAYNQNAENFHEKFSVFEEYRRQVTAFAEILPPHSRVLDIGCGTGVNAGYLVEAGHEVTGVDNSAGMLELARKYCSKAQFEECSVLDYYPAEKYDAVIMSFIIVHLNDADAVELLRRVPDFLNPQGYLYLSYMSGKSPGFETTSFSDSEIFFNYYNSSLIRDKLAEVGFALLKSNSAPFEESDGSLTEEFFQIYNLQ